MVKILITAAGSSNARALVDILCSRFKEIKIIGSDSNESGYFTPQEQVKTYHKVPLARDNKYPESILEICKNEDVDIVIPVFDDEVIALAKERTAFKAINVKLFVSSFELLVKCRDKFEFFKLGIARNLPVIHSALLPEMDYPLFLKPRYGNGSKDCYKIWNKKEAEILSSRIEKHLFQEYIEGVVLDVDFVANAASEVTCVVIKEEIETKNGIGVKIKILDLPEVIDLLEQLISSIGFVGLGAVEFFKTPEGRLYIIEINIRASSGIIFSYMAGADIMGHYLHNAGFDQIRPIASKIKYNKRMNRELVVFELE